MALLRTCHIVNNATEIVCIKSYLVTQLFTLVIFMNICFVLVY